MQSLYRIERYAAMYRVYCGNVIVFSSMSRKNCKDFIADNILKDENREEQHA